MKLPLLVHRIFPRRISFRKSTWFAGLAAAIFVIALLAVTAPVYLRMQPASEKAKVTAPNQAQAGTEVTPLKAPTTVTTSTTSTPPSKLAPYDPRNTGPLQPTPDKSVPVQYKPLLISPATVTVDKNYFNATTLPELTISSSNGAAVSMPALDWSDMRPYAFQALSASTNYQASWNMQLNARGMPVGDFTATVVAHDNATPYPNYYRGNVLVHVVDTGAFTVTPSTVTDEPSPNTATVTAYFTLQSPGMIKDQPQESDDAGGALQCMKVYGGSNYSYNSNDTQVQWSFFCQPAASVPPGTYTIHLSVTWGSHTQTASIIVIIS